MDVDVMLCVGVTQWYVLDTKDVFDQKCQCYRVMKQGHRHGH